MDNNLLQNPTFRGKVKSPNLFILFLGPSVFVASVVNSLIFSCWHQQLPVENPFQS